jgi:hypothetical protein
MSADSTLERTGAVPTMSDPEQLAGFGVRKVPIPDKLDATRWAEELSKVTPLIMTEGDVEYAFYRNILDEPDFPFNVILDEDTEIGKTILRNFDVTKLDELRLDDAFCIHYNMDQEDTSGARHMDPSDITVNMCLERSDDAEGSEVMFYGTKPLRNVERGTKDDKDESFRFLVKQEAKNATIHGGSHPHETMPLKKGRRTNIVITYCYKDPSRSDVSKRTCYYVE